MIIATDKRDDNLEVDEIISRHVRVASLYSFGIKRLAKQWTSPDYIHLFLIDKFSCFKSLLIIFHTCNILFYIPIQILFIILLSLFNFMYKFSFKL